MSEKWTAADLESCCRYWQKELRLQDWSVRIQFAYQREFGMEEKNGDVLMFVPRMEALIRIALPGERRESFGNHTSSIEETVVHELLHLFLSPLIDAEPESLLKDNEEQAVNRIAAALVRRSGWKKGEHHAAKKRQTRQIKEGDQFQHPHHAPRR